MDPQGVRGKGQEVHEVHEDHKSEVLYPLKPLLQVFRGPSVVLFDSLGVRGNYFWTFRCPWSKKG